MGERPVSSIRTAEYDALLRVVRQARQDAGLTQRELSAKMGKAETFIVKVERGTRRLDLIELAELSRALNINLAALVQRFIEAACESGPHEPGQSS